MHIIEGKTLARGGLAALLAITLGIACGGCATTGGDGGESSAAEGKVRSFHEQAQRKIAELDEVKLRMQNTLATFRKYGAEALSLADESGRNPEGYEAISGLLDDLKRRRARMVETYRSESIIPNFEEDGKKADAIAGEIDNLFDQARKSIFVHYIADRAAKRLHEERWRKNKGARDAAMNDIQAARDDFEAIKSDIIAFGERLNSNLAKIEIILSRMPRVIQLLNEDDQRYNESIKGEKMEDLVSRPKLIPEKDGWHRFKHWSKEKNGAEYKGFGRDTFLDAPRTLWAVFEEIPVTATFFTDGTGKPFANISLYRTKSGRIEAPAKAPERWGYEFVGWARKGSQGFYGDFGTALMEDVVLEARWEEAPFKVSFRDFDGKELETRTLRLSDVVSGSLPEAAGYRYGGWSLKKGGEKIPVGAKLADCVKAPAKELTLYAVREAEAHKAVFIGFGGKKVGEAEGSAEKDAKAPNAPKVDGYRFEGWFSGDDECFKGGKMKLPRDVTVTAKYAPITFKATFFDGESKERLEVEPIEFSVEKPLQLPAAPTVRGFKTAWSLKPEGNAMADVDVKATSDISVYFVRLAEYAFYSGANRVDGGISVIGSPVTPPRLLETRHRTPISPKGWSSRSGIDTKENFIDFGKFRIGGKTFFYAVWPDPTQKPDVIKAK
ncbi:MAG: InlB B-repeat-containing protein [Kiritimatiellae bacterium]|nr:InlB B-repeat-containing protein [Kiritimatiellia bacterium]